MDPRLPGDPDSFSSDSKVSGERKSDPLPLADHSSLGDEKAGQSFFRLMIRVLVVVFVLVLLAAYPLLRWRAHQKQMMYDMLARMNEPQPTPPMPPAVAPLQWIDWDDETGGILPRTCGIDQMKSGGYCPEEEAVEVLLRGRALERKMILVKGLVPIETLSLDLAPDNWIRLCHKGAKDVVLLSKGADPCASEPVKAWAFGNDHLVEAPTKSLTCDTSSCARYRGRTEWGKSAPVSSTP